MRDIVERLKDFAEEGRDKGYSTVAEMFDEAAAEIVSLRCGVRNPNNCKTCDYTKLNANREGHCYMFRDEPTEVCMQHTGRNKPLHAFGDALADAMADMPELRDELVAAGLVTANYK